MGWMITLGLIVTGMILIDSRIYFFGFINIAVGGYFFFNSIEKQRNT